MASGQHRLAMLKCALAPWPQLRVNDMELQRTGVSYTIDTLVAWRDRDSLQPLCLIIGMDGFESLPGWRRWRELTDYAHLVLINRQDHQQPPNEQMQAYYAAHACCSAARLHDRPGGYIYKTAFTIPAVSSSQIRALIGAGDEPGDLLPAVVSRYIRENKLYS